VLERVRDELVTLPGAGMSVLEMSHRSSRFEEINEKTSNAIKSLLGLSDEYSVLFLQGGASLQFTMVPLNLLSAGARADYLLTGDWGNKAFAEARKVGSARVAASTQDGGFTRVPNADEIEFDADADYVHFTTNETIGGVQWPHEPQTNGVPLVADASSDILSRPINAEKYGLIYAGAQKNLGPSGVTVVIVKEALLRSDTSALPTMLNYRTHLKNRSLYNTPNTFGIYMIGLVCEWIASLGGLETMQKRNAEKAALVYGVIDGSGFYRGHAEITSRSAMNVTWRLGSEELEQKFVAQAEAAGLIGLKGHRSVGGLRASLYNALPLESVKQLVGFMEEFERRNG
jgi:phosphoserine aminotransferase